MRRRNATTNIAGIASNATSVSWGEKISIAMSATIEQDEVAHHDRQERQHALDERGVARRATHELARLHLVVAGEVESLQPLVDRVAQIELHVERDPSAGVAAHERHGKAEQTRYDER